MSNNTDLKQAFIAQSSTILANEKSMLAVDALTYAYNSETFRRLIDGRLASLSLEELLELFKEETIQGKLS